MEQLKGKAVSAGIAIGKALLFNSQKETILKEKIGMEGVVKEIWRLDNAVKKTLAQLKKIQLDLQKAMGQDASLIIETQHTLLKDSDLLNDIKTLIRSQLVKSEWAIHEIEKKYSAIFSSIPDISFREKSHDISDILNRLILNLKKTRPESKEPHPEEVILVADDLSPSEAAKLMSRGKILGMVLDRGGETSHTVILARALEIPAIVNTQRATALIASGDQVVIDSINAEVIIQPSQTILAETAIKKEKYQRYRETWREVSQLPDQTRDHRPFTLLANIELPSECDTLLTYGARGIGLFRTEFIYLDAKTSFSEDEQTLIYKNIAQRLYPHPVVIRTFDLGRDKADSQMNQRPEANPSLGMMAVRYFLKQKEAFKIQIRAILRANISGNIRILFPMVTEVEEVNAIKDIIAEAREELKRKGGFHRKETSLGIMIEIPAAVRLIPHLTKEVDFFSIGTNDLTQYLLAVDRNNSALSYLFSSFHPAVIHTLQEIQHEVAAVGKEVTVCGEMAGKVLPALMLLGMGYSRFSMNPFSLIEIKRVFTSIHHATIRKIVRQIFHFSSRTEIEEYLIESLLKKYPRLFLKQQLL